MSARKPTAPTNAPPTHRTGSAKTKRVNRSEIQAIKIRAAASAAAAVAAVDDAPAAGAQPVGPVVPTRPARGAAKGNRAVVRTYVLTKAQEYRYIRDDLRRLLVTAAGLLVLMIVILWLAER